MDFYSLFRLVLLHIVVHATDKKIVKNMCEYELVVSPNLFKNIILSMDF